MRSTKLPSWIERLTGLEPVPPPPDVFALDAHALRFGRTARQDGRLVVDGYESVELPPDTFTEGILGGALRDPDEFQGWFGELMGRMEDPPKEASLVLPDDWLRITFAEIAELPKKPVLREEMLRWKLKRLVPFRVEDLRISAVEVTPFPRQEEPRRLMMGFALEALIVQLEAAFAAAGIAIGQITNTTLALLACLEQAVEAEDLAALVKVEPDAYTLSFVRAGEPLIYRYKAFTDEMPETARASSVRRDLRLTISFVRGHFPQNLRRIFLAAPPELEEAWMQRIGEEIGLSPEPLGPEHFPLAGNRLGPGWLETAPILGAANLEVA